jgi:hypothetical protein
VRWVCDRSEAVLVDEHARDNRPLSKVLPSPLIQSSDEIR